MDWYVTHFHNTLLQSEKPSDEFPFRVWWDIWSFPYQVPLDFFFQTKPLGNLQGVPQPFINGVNFSDPLIFGDLYPRYIKILPSPWVFSNRLFWYVTPPGFLKIANGFSTRWSDGQSTFEVRCADTPHGTGPDFVSAAGRCYLYAEAGGEHHRGGFFKDMYWGGDFS